MPGVCFLNDHEITKYSSPDDPDCLELLEQMNRVSGRTWLVKIDRYVKRVGLFRREIENYTLFLDCHGEYQVMNLVPQRGTAYGNFNRDAVMNFMLGYISGSM